MPAPGASSAGPVMTTQVRLIERNTRDGGRGSSLVVVKRQDRAVPRSNGLSRYKSIGGMSSSIPTSNARTQAFTMSVCPC